MEKRGQAASSATSMRYKTAGVEDQRSFADLTDYGTPLGDFCSGVS